MKNWLVVLALAASTLFSARDTYKAVVVVSYDEMALESIDVNGLHLNALVTINNPNNYDIQVQFEELGVSINQQFIGYAELKKPVKLNSNSTEQYPIAIKCALPSDGKVNLGQLTASALFGGGVVIDVKGNIVGKAKGISKKVPIEISQKLIL